MLLTVRALHRPARFFGAYSLAPIYEFSFHFSFGGGSGMLGHHLQTRVLCTLWSKVHFISRPTFKCISIISQSKWEQSVGEEGQRWRYSLSLYSFRAVLNHTYYCYLLLFCQEDFAFLVCKLNRMLLLCSNILHSRVSTCWNDISLETICYSFVTVSLQKNLVSFLRRSVDARSLHRAVGDPAGRSPRCRHLYLSGNLTFPINRAIGEAAVRELKSASAVLGMTTLCRTVSTSQFTCRARF